MVRGFYSTSTNYFVCALTVGNLLYLPFCLYWLTFQCFVQNSVFYYIIVHWLLSIKSPVNIGTKERYFLEPLCCVKKDICNFFCNIFSAALHSERALSHSKCFKTRALNCHTVTRLLSISVIFYFYNLTLLHIKGHNLQMTMKNKRKKAW